MSASFFSKYAGPGLAKLVSVDAYEYTGAVALDLDGENTDAVALALTPAQAKALGRALIKAGKFVEKKKGGAT